MNNNKQNDNHDLENASNVLGSMYNTNNYNPEYKEKKGMKFFVVMVVIITLVSAVFLMIKPYPTLEILVADNEGITSYRLDINIYGRYLADEGRFFPYSTENAQYMGLEGRYAHIAISAAFKNADMLIADADTLGTMSDKLIFFNTVTWLNTVRADVDSMLENSKNGYYGLPVSTEFSAIPFEDGYYIALLPKEPAMTDRQMEKVLRKMTAVYD